MSPWHASVPWRVHRRRVASAVRSQNVSCRFERTLQFDVFLPQARGVSFDIDLSG
jgi:hypothetical protein